jgi:hypothetical protein
MSVQRLPAQTTQTGETLVEYTVNSNMQLTTQLLKEIAKDYPAQTLI